MKKVLIASGIALFAIASIAGAQGYTFNTNLTVGSTGSDVVALQTWLMASGYSIPSIASGAASKGYFGSQTQSAVKAYQASKGIPNTGFVGPLTRGALNGGYTAPVAVSCPAGFICTAVGGTAPTTPATPGYISTPGIAGTLAFTLQGSPSGATLDKGESEDIARFKLQASASDMQVTSLALDFDVRLWLYASSIVIKDDAGAVIASKSGLTQNDFTELTVGSSYRLYVPVSYVVPRAVSKYFTVNVSMLPASDRCSSNCTLTLINAQVRSVDGTGVTDTQTDSSDRTFTFTGTNSGQLVTTVNASSPLKKLVQISNSNETTGVVLGVVDLKSQNKDATLRTFKIAVKTDGTSVNTLFSRIKIKAGGTEYTANTIATSGGADTTSSSTVTFTDLMIPLPKDVYVPVTIMADVAKPSSTGALDGKSASTTLVANATNIVAEDSTFNSVTVNAGTVVSSDQIFSASGAVLSNMSAVLGPTVESGNVTVAQSVSFTYTLTAGDNTLYVSGDPRVAVGTTTTGYTSNAVTNASTTLSSVTVSPSELSGDSVPAGSYYVVPAGGSRTFTWTGTIKNDAPSGVALRTFYVNSVNYGTSASALGASSINYNLGALKVSPVI